MLCRQVRPETNGIEQIYIIKSENGEEVDGKTADGKVPASLAMDPEEVDVKQEPPSDDEQPEDIPLALNPDFSILDVIIKEEPDELDGSGNVKPSTSRKRVKAAKKVVKAEEEEGSADSGDSDYKPQESSSDDSVSDDDETKGKDKKTRESKRDDDSDSDSSGVDDPYVPQKKSKKKKEDNDDDDDSSDSSGVNDPDPVPRKKRAKKICYNKRKKYPGDPPIRQHVIKRFVCHYCPTKFATLYNKERHEKMHEASMPPEKRIHRKQHFCYVCKREHLTKEELNDHLCNHVDMLPFNCTQCDDQSGMHSVRMMNRHMQLHEEMLGGIIECRFCAARFHSHAGCREHEKGHVNDEDLEEAKARAEIESKRLNVKIIIKDGLKRYQCEYCDKNYSLVASLRRHVNEHTLEKVYVCKTCGKSFSKCSALTLHERSHSDFAPYKCETCDKAFKDVIRLVQHRHLHTGQKPCVCHCGLSFIKKGGLNKHQRKCVIPKDLGACTCRFCKGEYPSYLELIKHVKETHEVDMEEAIMCRQCPKMFKDAVQLVNHEIQHQLPTAIKCTKCSRIFNNTYNLEQHMQTHVESFVCDVCGKTFTQNVNLRVHRRLHYSKRSHVCDLCSTAFICPAMLRKHRLKHYNPRSKFYIPNLPNENEQDESIGLDGIEAEQDESIGLDGIEGENEAEDAEEEEDISLCEPTMTTTEEAL
ncbi:AAEL004889-PA [Aedes aegypti]|uniref:AAEL004889-PA n=1 Tax=Aedes aegypti TaxID=7159 RepID=Q17BQ4_AEDAE|nr:AAEL004889-PA [Aedes aegypti]